jgi:hypothetical protein
MPLQFVDGKIIPWIKHSQKETNEKREKKIKIKMQRQTNRQG